MYCCSSNDVYQWCRPVTAQSQKIFPIHAKHAPDLKIIAAQNRMMK